MISDTFIFTVLYETQEFRLDWKRKFTYLVKEEGSTLTTRDTPGIVPKSVGNSSLDVAEKLALKEFLVQ